MSSSGDAAGGGVSAGASEPSVPVDGTKKRLLQHISHPIATMGQRLFALIIDLVIVLIVTVIIWAVFSLLTFRLYGAETLSLGLLALSILYFILFESLDGQTIGKKVIGIRVVSADTMKQPDLGMIIIRNILRIVDSLPLNLYIIGFIVGILNERHQRLGDYLARTIVVSVEERMG